MTTALSTASTKIFQFHSSIFPCYKELCRRRFFSSLSSSSAKQNQVSMGLLSYQLRRLCLWVVSIQSRRRKGNSERLQSALLKTAVLIVQCYRSLPKCYEALSLHGQLTFSSAFCVVVVSMKNTYSAFRNRRNERIVDRGRLLCICYNVTTNVRLIWDLSIINRSFETGAQTEWSHWRISIQLTRILWLIRLMFW